MATKTGKGGTGQENYDPKTGKYLSDDASSNNSIDTSNMTEEEIKNHNIDKTVNVPQFEKNFMPFFKELFEKHNAKIFSVEEAEQYRPGLTAELDKQGVDYIINAKGELIAVDLKSIQPFEGKNLGTMITLPIENFDTKTYDKKKKKQGKHIDGWFLRENATKILAFQFLTNQEGESPEAFLVSKDTLKETIVNNYFSGYASNNEECFKRLKNEFITAKNQILNQNVNIEKYGYKVIKNEENKPTYISKIFKSENYGHIVAKMKFDYNKEGEVNHNLVLICPKSKLKDQMDNYVSLNREEKDKHDVGKLLGVVI